MAFPNQQNLDPNRPVPAPGTGGPGVIDFGWGPIPRDRLGPDGLPMLAPRGAGSPADKYHPILPPSQGIPETPPDATMPAQPAPSPQPPQRQGFRYDYQQQHGFSPVSAGGPGAVTQQVEPNQLMRTHINELTDDDSLYMRRARQLGVDRAATRGIGNSSIAGGNAMASAIDRAAPIAQFDAARYGRVGDLNQQQTNMVNMANADRSLRGEMFNQQHQLAWDQFGHGRQMDIWQNTRADRHLDATLYQGQMSSYFQALSSIYNNPNLSAEEQNIAARNLGEMYPGFSEQAWQSIPPGLLSGPAVPAAQMMPPMEDGVLPGYGGGSALPPTTGPQP